MSGLAPETRAWLEDVGFTVKQEPMWLAALTHGSTGEPLNYERLEFLGDRVLGLAVAQWLYDRFDAPEGKVKFHASNHHLWKHARIGAFQPDGQVNMIYESPLIEPNPFPKL